MAKHKSSESIPSSLHPLTATNVQRLHQRNGVYYFRAKVPSDVRTLLPLPYSGKKEIKISLKTKDKVHALSLFSLYSSKIDQMFVDARLQSLVGISQQPAVESPSSGKSFEAVVQLRIDQMRIDRRAEKSIQEFYSKMQVFTKLLSKRLGSKFSSDIGCIHYEDIAAVLSELRGYEHNGKRIGARTAYAYGVALATLFKFAVKHRMVSYNPMPQLVKPKEVKNSRAGAEAGWKALGEGELTKLFQTLGTNTEKKKIDMAREQAPEYLRLRTLLALYSGLRIEEICSLRCDDIQGHEGIVVVSVNDSFGKHVKSDSSIRIIPLHSAISEMIVTHRDQMIEVYGHTPSSEQLLWSDVKSYRGKYSTAFTKQFGRYLRKHVSEDKLHVFHSLRKNFAQRLQQAGVQRELVGELLGHSDQSVTTLYTGSFSIQAKLEAVSLLEY